MSVKPSFEHVCGVVAETLGIGDRAAAWTPGTELFGSIPELDSLAVVEVLAAVETRFGITVEAEDLSVEAFATLGSFHDFVAARAGGPVVGEAVVG